MQYDLCNPGVYSREITNMILAIPLQMSGLVKNFKIWDFLTDRLYICDKCQTLHDATTH